MKVTANIATYPPRIKSGSLQKTINSLINQVDLIRIYFNGTPPKTSWFDQYGGKVVPHIGNHNKADNGKFQALDFITEPEIYLCCDDDLIYPPDYRTVTEESIKKYGCIICYHGRIIDKVGVPYYYSHQSFHCLNEVKDDVMIDVCGTGVTAFDTRYFHPKGLANDQRLRMADLLFSLEASKQKKRMGVIKHKAGWIKHTDNKETIHDTESRMSTPVQDSLADEIYFLKYKVQ